MGEQPIEPASRTFERGARRQTRAQQLAITLRDADGSLRDVTSQCRFEIEPAGIATVSARRSRRCHGQRIGRCAGHLSERDSRGRAPRRAGGLDPHSQLPHRHRPLLSKAGCNMGACHGNLNGKGGFKLSLRGDDPSFDYQSLTHDQSGRRLSRIAPESSLIVLKPTGAIPHEGGLRFAP